MKYPSHIEANIYEVSGNFYKKKKLVVKSPYSLHTEPSFDSETFNSKIVNDLKYINEAQKDNIPLLWHSEEWANDFFAFIEWLIGDSNESPDVLEIHPPYKDYCRSFGQFLKIFRVFYDEFHEKHSATTIVIENRFGTRYKGGKFLLSKCCDILEFCKVLKREKINLKIVIDYPQLFSAEVIPSKKKEENWMGANPSELLEKIIKFNLDLKKYKDVIGEFHMWGKLKNKDGKGWKPHAGNFDTFFSDNKVFKHEFLSSVFSTFNDDTPRYFVPEVISGIDDLRSIVAAMDKEHFIFI
jgi:hypothetical protein